MAEARGTLHTEVELEFGYHPEEKVNVIQIHSGWSEGNMKVRETFNFPIEVARAVHEALGTLLSLWDGTEEA